MNATVAQSIWTGCRCFICGRLAVRVVTRPCGHVHVCGPDTTAAELARLGATP
jgi:hypothetical protein